MTDSRHDDAMETVAGTAGVLAAGGVLTFMLAPFMVPGVVLLVALALPLVPLGVVAALFAGVCLLLRSVVRLARRDRPSPRPTAASPA